MRALIGLIAFLFFLSFAESALAARSLIISANKDSLFGDEEIALVASASGFTNEETIYIKGAFYKEGTTNYFGYTKNGENWIKNGDSTSNQKSIKIGEWDGSLIAKSDFSDSGFGGEGGYKLKIGFYYTTSGGNLSSVNWSDNNLDINLNEPDPTPTPTPTITPTPTSVPDPTATPTKTPTPTPSRTPTPTLKLSPSPTLNPILTASGSSTLPNSILGESTESGFIVIPSDKPSSKIEGANNNLQKILIVIGGIFLIACAILSFRFYIKNQQEE